MLLSQGNGQCVCNVWFTRSPMKVCMRCFFGTVIMTKELTHGVLNPFWSRRTKSLASLRRSNGKPVCTFIHFVHSFVFRYHVLTFNLLPWWVMITILLLNINLSWSQLGRLERLDPARGMVGSGIEIRYWKTSYLQYVVSKYILTLNIGLILYSKYNFLLLLLLTVTKQGTQCCILSSFRVSLHVT